MKVGIDASRAFIKERTGTEEYSYRLIKELTKINDPFCQFFLYVRKGEGVDFGLSANVHLKKINVEKFYTQAGLSSEIFRNPVDVLFVPSHSVPFVHPRKTIVTVHGLEYKKSPECYSLRERMMLELNTRLSVKWAQKIITPSESAKNDLLRYYKVNPEKIAIINHGAGGERYQISNIENNNLRVDDIKILFIGRLEKRKNVANLVKAFNILRSMANLDGRKIKLTLVGRPGFGYEKIKKEIENSPFKKDIEIKGYVSEDEKLKILQEAYVLIAPSLAEGFGLPILEAQAQNVPVLCSDIPPFKEVAKDSVLYFDPQNNADIAVKMADIFRDEKLHEALAIKGSENVKNYSWEKCAKETMKVLIY